MRQQYAVQEAVLQIETDNETVTAEIAGLSETESQALKCWESYKKFCRRSVMEAWQCGRAFEEVYKELQHGGWGPWLESKGISKRTADRFRQLSKYYDEVGQLDQFTSVDQALRAARSKRKGPVEEVKPEVKTEGEASSRTPEEATGANGTRRLPDDTESAQENQQLRAELREAKDRQRAAEKETAELREKVRETEKKLRETEDKLGAAEKKIAELLQKNKQPKRQPEEKGTPKETTSVDQQQIYTNRAFPGNSEDPGPGGARTTAAPVSRENTGNSDPITGTSPPK